MLNTPSMRTREQENPAPSLLSHPRAHGGSEKEVVTRVPLCDPLLSDVFGSWVWSWT